METFSALLAICAGNSPVTGKDLMFSLIYAWINGWVNSGEAGDLGRHRAHYDIIVMFVSYSLHQSLIQSPTFILISIIHPFNTRHIQSLILIKPTQSTNKPKPLARPCFDIGTMSTSIAITGVILGLHPAHERLCYFVITSLFAWLQV